MATIRVYTTIEQSRKLAEILPLESADMKILPFNEREYRIVPIYDIAVCGRGDEIYAWSLAALMKLLPSEFTTKGETTYKIDIRKYALTDDVDIYQIAYGNYKWHEDGSRSWSDMINSGEREELIDACYDMIISLHELKLL